MPSPFATHLFRGILNTELFHVCNLVMWHVINASCSSRLDQQTMSWEMKGPASFSQLCRWSQGLECGENLTFLQVKNTNIWNGHLKGGINACEDRAAVVDCRWILQNQVAIHLLENRIWSELVQNKKCALEFRKYQRRGCPVPPGLSGRQSSHSAKWTLPDSSLLQMSVFCSQLQY